MKKIGILNAPLSKIIASMGHTDKLVICDCGLPIPQQHQVIDLSLSPNIPRFMDTLNIILEELAVEKAFIAEEIVKKNKKIYNQIQKSMNGTPIEKVSHENFKEMTRSNSTTYFVRTGEITPYANIILIAGVTF